MVFNDTKYHDDRSSSLMTHLYVIGIIILFFLWAVRQFLDRILGMYPKIISKKWIDSVSVNDSDMSELHYRLTKQLDMNGRYRIQIAGSVQFIKASWKIVLLIVSLIALIMNPKWYYDHFIAFDRKTANYAVYLFANVMLTIAYPWELVVVNYAKLNKSTIVHHWLTAFVACTIILGDYNPFATWYGTTGVVLIFPINILLAIRAQYANIMPELIRQGFGLMYYYYILTSSLNVGGQIYLIINGYFILNKITIYKVVYILLCICAWFYEDYHILKTLKEYSILHYEKSRIRDSKFEIQLSHELELEMGTQEVQSEDELK